MPARCRCWPWAGISVSGTWKSPRKEQLGLPPGLQDLQQFLFQLQPLGLGMQVVGSDGEAVFGALAQRGDACPEKFHRVVGQNARQVVQQSGAVGGRDRQQVALAGLVGAQVDARGQREGTRTT